MILDHHRIEPRVSDVSLTASVSTALSTTPSVVTRTPPPSRTVSVSNASLQTSASSSVGVTVPSVTVSASASQGLSATSVSVTRNSPSGRIVSVQNASLQTSVSGTVGVTAAPDAQLSADPIGGNDAEFDASLSSDPNGDSLEYRYDPGDGSGFTSFGQGTLFTHTYPSSGTYTATVEVREKNTPEQKTDTASDSVTVGSSGPTK